MSVTGWLSECQPLSCILFSTPDDEDSRYVSLGASLEFDRSVARLGRQPHLIEVEGVIRRACFDHSYDSGRNPDREILVCTDRANQLSNPRLIRVSDRSPAPVHGDGQ